MVVKCLFFLCLLLQSNKKQKDVVPTDTKKDKEPETRPPVALESSDSPKMSSSQPQVQPPSSSPGHSESRRSSGKAERGAKRHPRNKQAYDKATTDSLGARGGVGDGSTTAGKTVGLAKGNQQPQEPSANRTIAQPPKRVEEATSPAHEDTSPVTSSTANSNAPHTHPPAGRSPQTQRRDGDNKVKRLDCDQDLKAGVSLAAASGHTNTTQVRTVVVYLNTPNCCGLGEEGRLWKVDFVLGSHMAKYTQSKN